MDHDLLFEIGVEELPSSFVAGAMSALPGSSPSDFAELRLAHGDVHVFGTPRRLAVVVEAPRRSPTRPLGRAHRSPAGAAYDKSGNPTKAAEAFAKKLGCEARRASHRRDAQRKYLAGTRRELGRPTTALLGAL